jgi:DNA-binding NarL/FixJ family response regulator
MNNTAMNRNLNVVILEDDLDLSVYLRNRVNAIPCFHCEHTFETPLKFLAGRYQVDIVLLDVLMPMMNGLDAIDPILKKYPDASIIMNTIKDDSETIFEALKRGALGYIDKQSDDISFEEVLKIVAKGGAMMSPTIARKVFDNFRQVKLNFEALTPRERDVTQGILEGLSYKMIGEKFGISIDTVRMNIKSIYRKLSINSKSQLFKIAKEQFNP